MHTKKNNLGFSVVELALLLVIVGLIGAVGYKIYNTQKENDRITNDTEAVLEQPALNNEVPATIDTASDLEQVEKTLDEQNSTNQDDDDLSELESELSEF